MSQPSKNAAGTAKLPAVTQGIYPASPAQSPEPQASNQLMAAHEAPPLDPAPVLLPRG